MDESRVNGGDSAIDSMLPARESPVRESPTRERSTRETTSRKGAIRTSYGVDDASVPDWNEARRAAKSGRNSMANGLRKGVDLEQVI